MDEEFGEFCCPLLLSIEALFTRKLIRNDIKMEDIVSDPMSSTVQIIFKARNSDYLQCSAAM